jgi:hypothetical protein
MTILVPPEAVSNPFGWPLLHKRPAILQGEATEDRQSIEARTVYNKELSKIQRKALQYAIL